MTETNGTEEGETVAAPTVSPSMPSFSYPGQVLDLWAHTLRTTNVYKLSLLRHVYADNSVGYSAIGLLCELFLTYTPMNELNCHWSDQFFVWKNLRGDTSSTCSEPPLPLLRYYRRVPGALDYIFAVDEAQDSLSFPELADILARRNKLTLTPSQALPPADSVMRRAMLLAQKPPSIRKGIRPW